jgi:hypothetical protein
LGDNTKIEAKMIPPESNRDSDRLKDIAFSLRSLVAEQPDDPELAQKALDFLALVAGLKPVFVAGRGSGVDGGWQAAIGAMATAAGFVVRQGPLWDATPWQINARNIRVPDWYRNHCRTELSGHRAIYVCRRGPDADDIDRINAAEGKLTIAEETRLLGYPDCCVAAHYDRALRYHRATLSMLRRHAGGDESRMLKLLEGHANMAPATEEEIDDLDAAFDIRPAPFGSWNLCTRCAGNADSPSAALSARYLDLAGKTELVPLLTG